MRFIVQISIYDLIFVDTLWLLSFRTNLDMINLPARLIASESLNCGIKKLLVARTIQILIWVDHENNDS